MKYEDVKPGMRVVTPYGPGTVVVTPIPDRVGGGPALDLCAHVELDAVFRGRRVLQYYLPEELEEPKNE
jgi:hypothetical protein